MMKTRIGILGYGNLGKGVELAARQNDDIELVAIFSRRDPSTITPLTAGVPVFSVDDIEAHTNDIDVLVLGGGSATDLPEQTPKYAKLFNVVDSFDTHANIPQHFAAVDAAAKEAGKIGIISVGWDPGMFSVARLYANCILPEGGGLHVLGSWRFPGSFSDAIRRVPGVCSMRASIRYRCQSALDAVRSGADALSSPRARSTRASASWLAEEGADLAAIEKRHR